MNMEESTPAASLEAVANHTTDTSHESRLSIPFSIRFPAATTLAFITGLSLGLSHGSKTAGLRFRAENSHRFPTTSTGWYLYHKSKNYHMMLGGIKEGVKMGAKISFWGGGFFLVEEAIDRLRRTKDFFSTLIAGLSISGGFSAWNRFPLPTAGRTIKAGLYGGLAFGLAQDALGLARGRRLGCVDFLLGNKDQMMEDGGKIT
ncbi:hypothetical protein ACLMJK_008603 [Lecanora helva]